MNGKLFLALAITAVCAAVIAGLVIVGGPSQGQRDQFDSQRYEELEKLARALLCKHGPHFPGNSLPRELTIESLRVHCSSAGIDADDLTDDETAEPYSYQRRDDHDFSICANFHDTERTLRLNNQEWYEGSFNSKTGCVSGWYR